MINKEKGDNSGKSQGDTRVIVFERKTARLLAGWFFLFFFSNNAKVS